MINKKEILETIQMIESQHLDVRTITMAISLFDCIDSSPKSTAQKVYDKICRLAQNLVAVGNDISSDYGIPIVNKRISVTPISLIGANNLGYLEIAKALDKAAEDTGVD
ncbi:MAG TPA: DUF711 family protein, partial [Clostridiales bacterium]|nr:DUF711 family protein [Clostridiales bacterium]